MYDEYYGLSGNPFRLTPDRRFWFGSEGHRKAMSYLKYGLYQGEGFIVITGDVGTGKSTLVSQLFAELDSDDVVAAQIGTTQIDADEAIRLICGAFDIDVTSNDKAVMLSAFEDFLVEQNQMGRRVLLVVDEAQNLPMRTLEELRMLSNFNLAGQPLFQSFLIGQPQFLRTITHPDLAQLQQRVIASYRLEAMSEEETEEYIIHRLETVDWDNDPSFTEDAFKRIYKETRGVPRRINTLANRIMLFGSLEQLHEIDGGVVEKVIQDLRKEVTGGGAQTQQQQRQQQAHAAQPAPQGGAQGQQGAAQPRPAASGISDAQAAELFKRIASIESMLGEHEKALRELVDIAMGILSMDEEGDSPPEEYEQAS